MGSLSGGGNSMFDALLKRAGGAAGGGGLGKSSGTNEQPTRRSFQSATRDRLRRKLEKEIKKNKSLYILYD